MVHCSSNCALSNPVKTALNVSHSRVLWNKSCEIVGLDHFLAEPQQESTSEDDADDWNLEPSDTEEFDAEETMETLQLVGLDDLHNF